MMLLPAGLGLVGGGGGGGLTGLKSGLVSWWDLEEGSGVARTDSHGPNTLTETGGNIGNAAGVVGNCAAPLNGRCLSCPSTTSGLAFATGDFTVAAWLKTSDGNTGAAAIYDTSLNHRCWALLLESSIAKFVVSTDGSSISAVAAAGSGLADANFHLLIGWRSTTDGKIYVQVDNGTPVGVTFSAASSLFLSTTTPLIVGALNSTTYIPGCSIDSVGAWSRELTSTERSSLWNSGAGLGYSTL